jgi:hypothetical protein
MITIQKHRISGLALAACLLLGSASINPALAGKSNGLLRALRKAAQVADTESVKPRPLVDDSPIRPRLTEEKKNTDTSDSSDKKAEPEKTRRPVRRRRMR